MSPYFLLCLGLSLVWHLFGAVVVGTVPEPRSAYAQVLPPALVLTRPIEMLDVGRNGLGKPVQRPIVSERDPEYFGFPRRWAFGRFQGRPESQRHDPWVRAQAALTEIPKINDGWELADMVLEESTKVFSEPPAQPDTVLAAQSVDARVPLSGSVFVSRQPQWQLVLHGPLAQRACLLKVLPRFGSNKKSQSHSLLLGETKPQARSLGLRIRLWAGQDGSVRLVFLESSSGDLAMDDLALRAVRQWQFIPRDESMPSLQWGIVSLDREPSE